MVSVVIPTYNRAKTIRRAIESVLCQTYQNLEVIVVDDASEDETKKIVDNIQDNRIQYVLLEQNHGACYARNVGINRASGEYIGFLDSDDAWMEKKLERQLSFLKDSGADAVSCKFRYYERSGKVIDKPVFRVYEENVYEQLLYKNFIATGGLLAKADVLRDEMFDTNLSRYQDWDLALRIAKKYRVFFCNEILLAVYYQEKSITGSTSVQKTIDALKILYDKNREAYEHQENAKAFAHLNWLIGVRSLYTGEADYNALKLGASSGKKEKVMYCLARLGGRVLVKKIYSKVWI